MTGDLAADVAPIRRLPDDLLPHVRFLVGPTGSGKSTIAMRLAERWPITIVALDSMTLYRGFDIGTAKPTPSERERVPHRLIDVLGPDERFTVARYVDEAVSACRETIGAGRIPLFVGGAGLYLRSLARGLFDGPPSNPAIRSDLERRSASIGSQALHAELATVDPIAAAKIHPNDTRRVVRGLEVYQITGRTFSSFHEHDRPRDGIRAVWLDGRRDWLHNRINLRTRDMIAAGWLDEAARLLPKADADSIFWTMLGYPELAAVVRGDSTIDMATERIQTLTRQYAKRQITWFRGLPEATALTFEPTSTGDDLAAAVASLLRLPGA